MSNSHITEISPTSYVLSSVVFLNQDGRVTICSPLISKYDSGTKLRPSGTIPELN